MSVRLDRLQRALYEALGGVADVVGWAYGEQPRGTGSLLVLRLLAGPTPGNVRHARGTPIKPADSIVVRVSDVVEGERVGIILNGFGYRYDVPNGATLGSIRDALLASVVAGETDYGFVTATAVSTDGILLTADFLGGLRSLSLRGSLVSESPVFSGDMVLVTEGTAVMTIGFQAFARDCQPSSGAAAMLGAVLDRFQSVTVADALDEYGLGIWRKGEVVDLTAIAGAHWESRAALEISFAAKSVFVTPVDSIETVDLTVVAVDVPVP